jgi:hypothetical protein
VRFDAGIFNTGFIDTLLGGAQPKAGQVAMLG